MWTPDPATIITAEMKAEAEIKAVMGEFEAAIQALVDAKPREKIFRDGVTLASYVASTNPLWAAQAQTFVAWRDAVWAYAYAELEKVISGERVQPTVAEFIAEIDPIIWP